MNSRTRFSVSLLALCFGITTFTQAATSVPTGTAITVTIDQSVSSKNARAGQGVVATVAHDVTANDKVVSSGAYGLPDKTKIKIEAAPAEPADSDKAGDKAHGRVW